jgi:hypothetical protein
MGLTPLFLFAKYDSLNLISISYAERFHHPKDRKAGFQLARREREYAAAS